MLKIALATDLTPEEEPALRVAAGLALASGARLFTVHAALAADEPKVSAPVASLAERWGHPIDHVPMMHSCCDDVVDTVLDALGLIEPRLVVAATHGRSAWMQLLAGSVAEGIARNADAPTLLVPIGVEQRLVEESTGRVSLARVLIAAGDPESVDAALAATEWLAQLVGARDVDTVLVHVEDGTPSLPTPTAPPSLRLSSRSVPGTLVGSLAKLADELDASLVVMPTRGHDALGDALAGSHTEQVLRALRRPLLSVPLRRSTAS